MENNLAFHLKTKHKFTTCSTNSTHWYLLKRNENIFIQRPVYLSITLIFSPSSKAIFTVKFTSQLVYLLLFPMFYNSSCDIYVKFCILLFIAALYLCFKSESNWNIYQLIHELISKASGNKRNEVLIITTA